MTEISKEYAEALYALAAEDDACDEYAKALSDVADILKKNPDFIELLASPNIPLGERREVIDKVFGSEGICENIASFLKLLTEKGRIRDIFECIEDFEKLYKDIGGVATAYVTSAAPLTDDEKSALRSKLEKKLSRRVELVTKVDESILGGIIVNVDGRIMDGSLKAKLSDIREMLK